MIGQGRMLFAVPWSTYPGAYIIKMVDIVARAVFGVLIWAIAAAKGNKLNKLKIDGFGIATFVSLLPGMTVMTLIFVTMMIFEAHVDVATIEDPVMGNQ